MNQTSLFDPPIARKRDPETSRAAAVRRFPGLTAAEYAERMRDYGIHWYRAARLPTKRLSDLVGRNDVWKGEKRRCRVTNAKAAVYYPGVLV